MSFVEELPETISASEEDPPDDLTIDDPD